MDQFLNQAIALQNKFRNDTGDVNAPAMIKLRDETQKLVDEVKTQRNKGDLDACVQNIRRILDEMGDNDGINVPNLNDLKSDCTKLREAIRKLN